MLCYIASSAMSFLLLPAVCSSSQDHPKPSRSHRATATDSNSQKAITPQLLFQIELHGFLLWASFGFFIPVGILIIRMSEKVDFGRKVKALFYCHIIFEMSGVFLAIAGAALSIKNFNNTFSNSHQRMGLALYLLILVQPFVGFLRPKSGVGGRRVLWFFFHWFIGTGVAIVGILNVYVGFRAYDAKTSTSVSRFWIVIFAAEVAALGFIYLLQDRWDHMMLRSQRGMVLHDVQMGGEVIAPESYSYPTPPPPSSSSPAAAEILRKDEDLVKL